MKLNASNTAIIKRLLVGRKTRPLCSILSKIEPVDLASLFGTLSRHETKQLMEFLLSINKAVPTLLELPEQQLNDILRKIPPEQRLQLIERSDIDSANSFLSFFNEGELSEILEQIEPERANKIRQYLDYPEDSVGRTMITQVFSISIDLSASEALKILREKIQRQSIYYIYCVNQQNQLVGMLSLRQLATAPEDKPLKELVKKDVLYVSPESNTEEAARLVSRYDLIAIPVLSKTRELLGIITVDDVLDIIQEQATADIYAQAGLQESDRIFTPVRESIKKRLPWMFLNLFLAAIASSVVSVFEDTMAQLIILASFKNIVAGMGGNTAIQSLTVVTRGIATGDFSFTSGTRALVKEILVGITIGCVTGTAAGLLTYLWKGNLMVSIIICCSMILNSLLASMAGAGIPILLKRCGWDPAAGSGVLVTMVTDIFSFFSFFGTCHSFAKALHSPISHRRRA